MIKLPPSLRAATALAALACVLLGGGPDGAAATQAGPNAPSGPKVAAPTSILARVAFVGASATAGFGVVAKDPDEKLPLVPVPLSASFEGVVLRPIETYDLGSSFFFMNPGGTGRSEVDKAIAHGATLVIATDFLFWYVYGDDDGKGGRLRSEAARLDKLELGLEQLQRFAPETPILVGDLPDMRRAVGKMISQTQMPRAETLAKANERIAAWVTGRPRTQLFHLSSFVEDLKADQPITAGDVAFDPSQGRLIQSDDLHPTLRGSIAVALAVAKQLKDAFGDSFDAAIAGDEARAQAAARAAARATLERRSKPRPAEVVAPASQR